MRIKSVMIFAITFLFIASTSLFANRLDRAEKREAVKVLKRTALVLAYAQKEVKKNRVFTGNLAKAYRHQQFAKELYGNRNFERAIRQSLRARQLAWLAIKANKGRLSEDYDRDEQRYSRDMKSDDLDRDFDRDYDKKDKRKPQDREMTDDKIINLTIEAEFK